MNSSNAFSASACVSACQIACRACFAFAWADFEL